MAAPTSVTVEAQSMTTTVLRWAYSGTVQVRVHRSTDNVSFSEVTATNSVSRVDPGTTEFIDIDLAAGTKYYYKLSEDGASFSSTVSTYTHFCADQNAGKAFYLPRFDQGQEDQSSRLNDMAERVEAALGNNTFPGACIVCPADGAVVIDCTDGCNSFLVVADTDINSFTINRCGSIEPVVDVYVPPGTTVGVCGFPPGYGFTGNECTESPISGGDDGRTLRFGSGGPAGGAGGAGGSTPGLPKSGSANGGSGGGAGGTSCECVPGRNNELTLKCCTADCSLGCGGSNELVIKVCGGIGPYAFTQTGSVEFKQADGSTSTTQTVDPKKAASQVKVVPPENSGSGESGTAYRKDYVSCSSCSATPGQCSGTGQHYVPVSDLYGCNDQFLSTTNTSNCSDGFPATLPVTTFTSCPSLGLPTPAVTGSNPPVCAGGACVRHDCDVRTAGMISAGCRPCGVQSGDVITVTDSTGVSVSITVKA